MQSDVTNHAVAAFVPAALIGLGLGWSTSGHREQVPAPEKTTAKTAVRERLRPEPKKETLLEIATRRVQDRSQPDYNPLADELADWTNDEIRAALEESLVHPEAALNFGRGSPLTIWLLKEWIRRDFDEVLAWFGQVPSWKQARLSGALGHNWPAERAAEGLDFVRKNRDWFPSPPWALLVKNVEQHAGNGAAAVDELLRTFAEERYQLGAQNPIDFPAGFDFAALVEKPGFQGIRGSGLASVVLRSWFGQDREAAFDWVFANDGATGVGSLMNNPATGGSQKDVAWVAGKVEGMEPDARAGFLRELTPGWMRGPTGLEWFLSGVSDEGFKAEVIALAPQLVFGGRAHQALPMLEQLPDPATRIRLLENASPAEVFQQSRHMRRFPESDKALLREKLAEWNASETQIESILSRFEP